MLIVDEANPVVFVVDRTNFPDRGFGAVLRFFRGLAPELDQNLGIGLRKEVLAGHVIALAMLIIEHFMVEAFQPDRP